MDIDLHYELDYHTMHRLGHSDVVPDMDTELYHVVHYRLYTQVQVQVQVELDAVVQVSVGLALVWVQVLEQDVV